jgi:hypothetical protein
VMKRVAILISALLLSWVAAVPASAGNGDPTGSCSSGGTCQVQLEQMIKFSGSYSLSNNNTVVNIAPPPCLWNPIGDAITGSEAIIKEWGNDPAKAPTAYQINQSVGQANGLLQKPVTGQWYELPVNPAAGATGAAECLKLPLYAWVTPGNTPPAVPIPPRTLAQLAFAVLSTPTLGQITLNPATKSEVNLPTFVQVAVTPPPVGQLGITAQHRIYVYVTATLGPTTVTVWVESNALNIDPGTSLANSYDLPVCATTINGASTLGSHYTASQMSGTTVNQPIDCGATYLDPGTFNLQATVGWTACWARTANTAGPSLNWCARHPVPGAGALPAATATQAINVQEVQSVNNG